MEEQRNLGVSEARYALSLLICVLLGVGFLLLNQLGGAASAPPVETRTLESDTGKPDATTAEVEEPPRVLKVESSENSVFHTSQLPDSPSDSEDSFAPGAGSRERR